MAVAKHYDGSKSLRQGLRNTSFSWGEFTGNLHKKKQITTVIVNYYAIVFLVRKGPLGGRGRIAEKLASEAYRAIVSPTALSVQARMLFSTFGSLIN